MIVEDPPRKIEQPTDERVAQGIAHGRAFLLGRYDALIPEHGQLLRDDRLVQRQCLLQFLDGAPASDEDLQHPDPGGMGEGTEELRLERLQLVGDRLTDCRPASLLRH